MTVESLITQHIDTWTSAVKIKSTSGRGSSKKLELYGVKKLRELILELAVRGKLVPQDPSDEPASVLLERIATEKAQLVKDKKIKKQKALPEVDKNEFLFNRPNGWTWTRLGNLSSDIHYGYTASAKPDSEGVRLLRITDIQNDRVNWATVPACDIKEEKSKSYLLENNDILIARTGGTIGKSYLVENINLQAVFASYLIRVKRIEAVYAPFTKVFLGSQLYWKQLIENSAGTGQPNVNATALKQLLFILPPFEEQKRIVAKVDELMTLCDQLEQKTEASIEAHQLLVGTLLNILTNSADANELMENWVRISDHFDTLFTTEESIDQLKQTILQLAVMGKLVPQDPNDEPASVLLERIAEEKAQLIKEKKIKKQKALPPIADDEKPFDLPKGWEWERLGNAGIGATGKTPSTKKKDYFEGTLPFIGPGQITQNGQILEAEKYLSSEGLLNSTEAVRGDILMVCIGGSIGKGAIANETIGFNQQINSIRPVKIISKYLYITVKTDSFYKCLIEKSTGSATPIINRGKWEELLIPIAPLTEQRRIVEKIEELIAICDRLNARLKESQTTQLQLTNVIVKQAMAT
ncbi:restriction endonuclease subunit S (plasmid) [Photobacterium damselae]|uniref:restriction endonuclease subunit S n=1 Tax=Photobacterium damselae TaxID=38293 RepID=UPI0025429729